MIHKIQYQYNDRFLDNDLWKKQSLWKAEGHLREALSLLITAKTNSKTQEMLEQIIRQVEIDRGS